MSEYDIDNMFLRISSKIMLEISTMESTDFFTLDKYAEFMAVHMANSGTHEIYFKEIFSVAVTEEKVPQFGTTNTSALLPNDDIQKTYKLFNSYETFKDNELYDTILYSIGKKDMPEDGLIFKKDKIYSLYDIFIIIETLIYEKTDTIQIDNGSIQNVTLDFYRKLLNMNEMYRVLVAILCSINAPNIYRVLVNLMIFNVSGSYHITYLALKIYYTNNKSEDVLNILKGLLYGHEKTH